MWGEKPDVEDKRSSWCVYKLRVRLTRLSLPSFIFSVPSRCSCRVSSGETPLMGAMRSKRLNSLRIWQEKKRQKSIRSILTERLISDWAFLKKTWESQEELVSYLLHLLTAALHSLVGVYSGRNGGQILLFLALSHLRLHAVDEAFHCRHLEEGKSQILSDVFQ